MSTTGSTTVVRILKIFALFAIIGVSFAGMRLFTAEPCTIPKTWSVGRVDPQFGISKQLVAQYGKEATEVWNTARDEHPLFAYKEVGGEVVLNFTYDERMQTTIRNQRLKRSIDEGKNQLSDIKQTLESLKSEYVALESTVSSLTATYNGHLNTYNKEVTYWNGQGGAPKDTYARLERDKANLEDERVALNTKIQYYNQVGEKIRTYGENHNEIVENLNEKITSLNETSAREFEEGIYDPNDNTITIYEYASPVSLKRVLMHEFGHALSIGHVDGENSIMYPVNQGRSLTLSNEDIVALDSACKKEKSDGVVDISISTLTAIRDGISRLVVSSLRDTTAQSE